MGALLNAGFEEDSNLDGIPDDWTDFGLGGWTLDSSTYTEGYKSLKNTDPSSILRSDDFVSVDTNKNWHASIDLKAIDYGQFLLVSLICYDQNQSGLEERIITQDSDIFWSTYTLDLSGEGSGANQFPAGTEYIKFNIVATTDGPIWFDNVIFSNEENFAYNAANQITNTGFSYDDNGNLTSDGVHAYIYDGENRLKEVKQGANTIASYTYDYMGRRTSKTVSGVTTYFHYDGWNVVAETDQTGATIATYSYDNTNQLVSMTKGGQTYYYQYNAHGDVVSLTSSASQVVNTYEYDPWGKVLSANETVENPYRYAGYRYDSETGLYYLQARYYEARICRFLAKDPDGGDAQEPLALNPYLYCVDNPVNLVDPDGCKPPKQGSILDLWDTMSDEEKVIVGVAVVGGLAVAAGFVIPGGAVLLGDCAYAVYVGFHQAKGSRKPKRTSGRTKLRKKRKKC